MGGGRRFENLVFGDALNTLIALGEQPNLLRAMAEVSLALQDRKRCQYVSIRYLDNVKSSRLILHHQPQIHKLAFEAEPRRQP